MTINQQLFFTYLKKYKLIFILTLFNHTETLGRNFIFINEKKYTFLDLSKWVPNEEQIESPGTGWACFFVFFMLRDATF